MAVLSKKPTVTVLEPGSVVTLWGGINARIVAVMIEPGSRVSYRVKYWNRSALETEWVGSELIIDSTDEMSVGFKP